MEGFLFPATYQITQARQADALVAQQLTAFQRAAAQGRFQPRREEEPDALRRADHRLDDRARGRVSGRSREDRGRDLQPPARRTCRSGSTPRSSTRSARGSVLDAHDLLLTGRYNTRTHRGLPPTPICNPGLASLQAAAQPGEGAVPVLRGDPRRQEARATTSRDVRRLPALPADASGMTISGTTRVACVIGDPVEHSRSPGMHNAASAALGLDRVYVALRVDAGRSGARDPRPRRARLRRRQRHGAAQDRRARAVRRARGGGRRCRCRQHAELRPRRPLRGDLTDGLGLVAALPEVPASARSCSAPAAARAPRARRSCAPGRGA